MKRLRNTLPGILSALLMILLILDTKTALTGAKEGIILCLYTVIPSLFPFLILTTILNNQLLGRRIPALRHLGRLLAIPNGAESLLLLGIVGGYPVGAQAISDAFHNGQLDKHTAHRLLGFCSNAGPAFLFGMISSLFSSPVVVWIIWGIHILSAWIVGVLLPGKSKASCSINAVNKISIPAALNKSIKNMAAICSWVILFRVIAVILNRWFLCFLPTELAVLIVGFLELSNGCTELFHVTNEGARFVISNGLLAFGGVCVGMQTVSVTKDLGTGLYFPGKILQSIISILMSYLFQHWIFHDSEICPLPAFAWIFILGAMGAVMFFLYREKKVVALCH